jgi:hypothetical protein
MHSTFRRVVRGVLVTSSLLTLLVVAPSVGGMAPPAGAQTDPPPANSPVLAYTLASRDGGVYAFGGARFYGSLPSERIIPAQPIVGVAITAHDAGYWLVAADGGIFAFGNAGFYGSTGAHPLHSPVVSMAATPDGHGYWEVAADGGIFAFGDAGFYGSTGSTSLTRQMVGISVTPDGQGYWEVAADGGIFAFGDAGYHGSMSGLPLADAVTGVSSTPDGRGYWEVAADGGVFSFGDAGFYGAADPTTPQPGQTPSGGNGIGSNSGFFCGPQGSFFTSDADLGQARTTVAGIQSTSDGRGYYLFGTDSGIFAFGDARYQGSGGGCLNAPSLGAPLDGPAVGIAF